MAIKKTVQKLAAIALNGVRFEITDNFNFFESNQQEREDRSSQKRGGQYLNKSRAEAWNAIHISLQILVQEFEHKEQLLIDMDHIDEATNGVRNNTVNIK